jgi:transcription elongation factor GreA
MRMKHPMADKLAAQLKELMHELTVDIPKQLAFARSLGDLSENAEFKMTKERQLFVESRIKQVEELLQKIQGLNIDRLPSNKAAYGSRVAIEDADSGDEKTFLIIFPGEDPPYKLPTDTLVTMGSPIAQALFGKEEGDTVKVHLPKGSFEWEITRLETLHQLVRAPDA